jgi:hypothetical protein
MKLKRTLLAALALLVAGGATQSGLAQTAGTCTGPSATADLDINNVRARLYNNGGLFWKGAGNVYNVPKALPGRPITPNAIFASGIWIGGFVGTELRQAAATYSNWEFYAGPLNSAGQVPGGNCAVYDKIYLVSKDDIKAYINAGTTSPDLAAWPTGLGAPTFRDVNGNGTYERGTDTIVTPTSQSQTINLGANQLPLISGDQMAWWVMNDVGGPHLRTGSRPIGLEVQVSAFAFNLPGDLGNTTFYRYKLNYKGTQPLTQTYFGIFSDPDLGNASDDYVGADTTLGLGYVYNADNFDEGSDGYGTPPPAAGYDFFQGPLVPAPGVNHRDPDGTVYPNQRRLKMTTFVYYNNCGNGINCDPRANTADYYNFMSGRWQNGQQFYACGDGANNTFASCGTARIMFPGDPTAAAGQRFWSEFQPTQTAATPNAPSDRRFALATGPFTINPGDSQTLVFGIVYGRGENNIASVTALKRADALAQSAFDNDFVIPAPPDAPRVTVTSLDKSVILSWNYLPTDNNYLERYDVFSPFTNTTGDRTYTFEGYRVYRYPTAEFDPSERELVATFDVNNGITRVLEAPDARGEVRISADGTDNGVQRSIKIDNLVNYRDYYFGVEAYAVNLNTDVSRVYPSTITRVVARPEPTTASGEVINAGAYGTSIMGTRGATNGGEGLARAIVVDPGAVTASSYSVRFYNATVTPTGTTTPITVLTYDITNTTTGQKVFDGTDFARRTGRGAPQQPPSVDLTSSEVTNLVQAEGLAFVVRGPAPGFKDFLVTRNAAGALNPPEYGTFAFNGWGFPHPTTGDRPNGTRQQSTQGLTASQGWGIVTFGNHTYFDETAGPGTGWFARVTRNGGNLPAIGANDFEWRFTGSSWAYRAFGDAGRQDVQVPFEIWSTGVRPDASDDVRMIPLMCEAVCGIPSLVPEVFDIGGDHPSSGGADDPYSDAIYWYFPADMTPGQAGYLKYANNGNPDHSQLGAEALARVALMGWNFGASPAQYANKTRPENGTVFQIQTFKPNQPGDTFVINAAPAAVMMSDSLLAASVNQIGISPNPYRGASAYEVSNLVDVARFTGLPDRASIRIFTLSGTLIRTLEKSGPERSLDWDLQTEQGLPIASGMYLIHVEAKKADGTLLGEKVIKFGVVKKRIQLDIL